MWSKTILLVLAGASAASAQQVITFDQVLPPGSGNGYVQNLQVDGFLFDSPHFHTMINFTPLGGLCENGSPIYLGSEGGSVLGGSTLTMRRSDGAPFTLARVDLAECLQTDQPGYFKAKTVRLVGTRANGEQVQFHHTLDGAADGAGGLADFEQVTVNVTNVVTVTFDGLDATGAAGLAYALDDVLVKPPCGLLDYGMGCAGTGGIVPEISVAPCPGAGDTMFLTIDQALGGQTALLALGLQQAAVPLPAGCTLNVAPLFPVIPAFPLSGMGPGKGTVTVAGALPAGVSGLTFVMQGFVLDPGAAGGIAGSKGLQFTIS